MHEKRIEIRWRDMDAFGHVNNAVYLTYFEEARDEWMEKVIGPSSDVWDFVLARVAVDFRHELNQSDDQVVVTVRLVKIGTSSITTREQLARRDGVVAAEAESVMVSRDRDSVKARPLTEAERAALQPELAADAD